MKHIQTPSHSVISIVSPSWIMNEFHLGKCRKPETRSGSSGNFPLIHGFLTISFFWQCNSIWPKKLSYELRRGGKVSVSIEIYTCCLAWPVVYVPCPKRSFIDMLMVFNWTFWRSSIVTGACPKKNTNVILFHHTVLEWVTFSVQMSFRISLQFWERNRCLNWKMSILVWS